VWLKKGSMTFPADHPIIMVGPGTGVAAFRAVIQERVKLGQRLFLVFGCRSEEDDFYYKEDWQSLVSQFENFTVVTAFSRADPTNGKTYVQHKIRENG